MLLAFVLLLAAFVCGVATVISFFVHLFDGSKITNRFLNATVILLIFSVIVAVKELIGG